MNKPHVVVGSMNPAASMALASAISRACHGHQVAMIEPESMQDQNAQPTPEQKPVVLVDDTKAPVDPELQVKPKSSCRHCYGRGYIGTDSVTKQKIICRCVKRSFERVNKLKRERDAQIKPAQVTASKGWDAPKAPVGNPEAVPA